MRQSSQQCGVKSTSKERHKAATYGRVVVIQELLAAGAEVDCKDSSDCTALQRATQNLK